MIKTNIEKVPMIAVQGEVWHSKAITRGRMDAEGMTHWPVGTGGITYNAKIGDCCIGWAADHLEPGVSSRNSDDAKNAAYVSYACVGNEATVGSGDAKGAKGIVTGKHGGCEHLMVYFDAETLEKMAIGDKINVKGWGQGMTLTEYPDIYLRNLSPQLLEKMNIEQVGDKLKVGVAKTVPACIMGSGLGQMGSANGDYDITLFDRAITEEYGLDELRFGDIVAIIDADTRFGRTFRTGSVTIGVIIHADCIAPGHGPGVTTLMTCKDPIIEPFIDPKANLADMFGV